MRNLVFKRWFVLEFILLGKKRKYLLWIIILENMKSLFIIEGGIEILFSF